MIIPAWHFQENSYPFDLNIILPKGIFTLKQKIIGFLKFLNLVDFHYKGRLIISSSISIETDPLLDKLYKLYLRLWNQLTHVQEVPKRRRSVEQDIIKWSKNLPRTPIGEFIHQYYSITLRETNWQSKAALWRTLRKRESREKKLTAKKLKKMQERYLKTWFKYFDKIDFSSKLESQFPDFIAKMNDLTFKDILPEKPQKICPVCEVDLGGYSRDIRYCPKCGYALFESVQKFCANCGGKLRSGANFCNSCGKKIQER